MRRVRVALVGAGDIGVHAHLAALLASPDVELVAVVDPGEGARAAAAAAIEGTGGVGVPLLVADVDELTSTGLDAFVVATPPWVTTTLVERLLHTGRFVLAEKPIATSVEQAAPLAALPAALTARLQVGFTYRHHRSIDLLRTWIADGRLGGPLFVRVAVHDERLDRTDREHIERIAATLRHGSPIMHEGAHVADWLNLLLGASDPTVEHAWTLQTLPELPGANFVGSSLRYASGDRAVVEVGWLHPALATSELTVAGPLGFARMEIATMQLTFDDGHSREQHVDARSRTESCFDRQLERFVALCRGDGSSSPGLQDALASLRLTERIAAAGEGR